MRTRHDYDDKSLFSRRYIRYRYAYDDQYARGVVVCCEGAVTLLAGLLVAFLLARLLGWLVGWLLACLVDRLVSWLIVSLLTCSRNRSLAHLLAFWFALLGYFHLLCLVDLRG